MAHLPSPSGTTSSQTVRPNQVLPTQVYRSTDGRGACAFRVVAVLGKTGYAECRGGRDGVGNRTRVRIDRLLRPANLKPLYEFVSGPLGEPDHDEGDAPDWPATRTPHAPVRHHDPLPHAAHL